MLEEQERRRSKEIFCCCGFCFVFVVGFLFFLGGGVVFDFVCLIAYFELLPYVAGQGRDEGRTGGTGR